MRQSGLGSNLSKLPQPIFSRQGPLVTKSQLNAEQGSTAADEGAENSPAEAEQSGHGLRFHVSILASGARPDASSPAFRSSHESKPLGGWRTVREPMIR